jgi:hypothetical protein
MSARLRTTRANDVLMSPRSARIRDITGMLVTAIPQAKTISIAVRFPAVPIKPPGLTMTMNAAPTAKGTTLPNNAMAPSSAPHRGGDAIEGSPHAVHHGEVKAGP